ncbi:hypothetical protein AB1Y20_020120 [Prymnesium parvum]|uniref:DNA damage-binding protein 1 n=1 Tax=Prymnesium parvum TaxID=97485 RepID=A0AB34JTS6_PRYPA
MKWNYVVTAHKPTNVTHALTGNFTGPDDINLIVSKCTRIEVHRVDAEGLHCMLDVPLYGRVATMELWRPAGARQDMLFLSTERYQFCILEYDAASGEIVTKAKGDVSDRIGRPADAGQIAVVDPQCRLIGLHLYDGLFKVIPATPTGQLRPEAYNIRLEELQVVDICFLYDMPKPTLALLYQDIKELRHLKTYEVLLKEKDFGDGPWAQPNIEPGASRLIPVAQGGVIVLGEQTITLLSGVDFKSISIPYSVFKAVGKIDETRYLLGDHLGQLSALVLRMEGERITMLNLEKLGVVSQPSALAYLDNGAVFVGSSLGDSQVIQLAEAPSADGTYLTEQQRWTNIGPIIDFVVVDLERQGQGQVVTCTGAGKDGSIRVVRNGIGINEQARVELPGVKGMWSLNDATGGTFLVLSFISETRVLAMEDDELGEVEIDGFDAQRPTVFCGRLPNAGVVQVSSASLRLLDSTTLALRAEWHPPMGSAISMACSDDTCVLLATAGRSLFLMNVVNGKWAEVATATMEHEVACVALLKQPLSATGSAPMDTDEATATTELPPMCAAGLWTDLSVRLLSLPSLEELHKELLGGEVIPRSLLFTSFEGRPLLMAALGDGHLVSFALNPPSLNVTPDASPMLSDRKTVSLGSQPVSLVPFVSQGQANVFACSDRPTVIHSNNSKLLYSNVNLKCASHMTPFDSRGFPDCLAIAADDVLLIGTIDDIQKLHIRTVPMGETPRRIAHLDGAKSFAVLTHQTNESEDTQSSFVRLLDDQTFERTHSVELKPSEHASAVIPIAFEGEPPSSVFVVVGTAFTDQNEPEPKAGRILVFELIERTLELRSEHQVKGAVYTLEAFNGKLLAGVNNKLQLYEWSAAAGGNSPQLRLRHEHCGHILVLYVASRGDFILVGDLMKSISLLQWSAISGSISEISRDCNANWMTAVAFLDDDTYLGSENALNLFVAKKNADATNDEERQRLEVVGEFHVGEFINRFRRGSLAIADSSIAQPLTNLIYGTVNGVLGVVSPISQEQYSFLKKVQDSLARVVKGVGGLSHSEWRAFFNERRTSEASSFIDGDLVESFLELPEAKMEEVVASLDVTVEELTRRVEELVRLH